MSKKKATKRSTVNPTVSKIAPTKSTVKAATPSTTTSGSQADLLFKKENYMYILGGIGLMVVGFFLMAGGHNDDPNVFDESVIYSTRRTLIAPIFILAGLVVQVLAIFKK